MLQNHKELYESTFLKAKRSFQIKTERGIKVRSVLQINDTLHHLMLLLIATYLYVLKLAAQVRSVLKLFLGRAIQNYRKHFFV